jgi:hypothetical protein
MDRTIIHIAVTALGLLSVQGSQLSDDLAHAVLGASTLDYIFVPAA